MGEVASPVTVLEVTVLEVTVLEVTVLEVTVLEVTVLEEDTEPAATCGRRRTGLLVHQ